MNERIINRLFSNEELWYNENIHSNLMSKIHSVLIDRKAERLLNQDEYSVQSTINDFISGQLRNTIFSSEREWGQMDNVVIHSASNEPLVIYEVKTFIKAHENTIRPRTVFKDILKLSIKKLEYPHIEAYMVIAGKTRVPEQALNNGTLLLPNKFQDIHLRSSMSFDLSYFQQLGVDRNLLELAAEYEITNISISPSRWRNYDDMCALSWRINKIK